MSALHTLLRGSIDYAGLFPPAGLGMAEAVANHAAYRESPHAWALGRFVVPVSRLGEFETARHRIPSQEPWRIAALLGSDAGADLRTIEEFNCRSAERDSAVIVDVVEAKADSTGVVERLLASVPDSIQCYVEIPLGRNMLELITAIRGSDGRAKIRTGGVTSDAFPSPEAVVRFIRACLDAGVPFKATAGLHHPLRAEYRLTYAADSPCGTMFGFLNLFLATVFMADGLDEPQAEELLVERDPGSIQVEESGISWRGRRVAVDTVSRARETGIISFGSCSFTEPVADLRTLGLV